MLILSIRTDKPEAELGLFNNQDRLKYITWPAHKELSATVHTKIKELLSSINKELKDIEGLVIYKGPGSFTGLRIVVTVANTLAYALEIPIVGTLGEHWLKSGIERLLSQENDEVILPFYGAEPHITKPKK